ncbi:ubiquitin-protein ligase E3 [Schizosaccharomyces japonicus yFS275]|uniref:RING-type E3 ubiquitin transferase n=1 Tax=Schizosaccharomyces japonicus (strain yFS275 / FY16936) TaxID=402676 RepID=B6JYD3_SCHJY|nr:ubiquitin-protein ligase E3 [Schizosaccharomyces japonicus yFS275]EEB06551.1 ubiquitin-protein ligase E3 [Schizosaccharomyces japonicus yFS275]
MESQNTLWYCHACSNEYSGGETCPRCGSDFIEMIDNNTTPENDPRNFVPGEGDEQAGPNPFQAFFQFLRPGSVQTFTFPPPGNGEGQERENGTQSQNGETAAPTLDHNNGPEGSNSIPVESFQQQAQGFLRALFGGALGRSNENETDGAPPTQQGTTDMQTENTNTAPTAAHGDVSPQSSTAFTTAESSPDRAMDTAAANAAPGDNSEGQTHAGEQNGPREEQPNRPFATAQSFVFAMGPNGTMQQISSSNLPFPLAPGTDGTGAEGPIPIADLGTTLERIFGSLGAQPANGQGFNPATVFGELFNLAGNPGDYVWGARGLDDIISQLMEQTSAQHAPPPAPESVIEQLPVEKVPQNLVDEEYECTVCLENFKTGDDVVRLPCKHYFHEQCIKPWLRVNGTCAVCRAPVDPNAAASTSDRQRGPANDSSSSTNNEPNLSSTSSSSTAATATRSTASATATAPASNDDHDHDDFDHDANLATSTELPLQEPPE